MPPPCTTASASRDPSGGRFPPSAVELVAYVPGTALLGGFRYGLALRDDEGAHDACDARADVAARVDDASGIVACLPGVHLSGRLAFDEDLERAFEERAVLVAGMRVPTSRTARRELRRGDDGFSRVVAAEGRPHQ